MGLVLLEMVVYGGIINSFSIFIIPICETLGASRGEYSLAIMPYTIMCSLSNIIFGAVVKRLGYKWGTIISLLLAAAGTVAMSFSQSLYALAIGRVLFALGYGFCFTAGAVLIVRSWFWKCQGLIIGLVTMGTGIGGSLMTVILTSVTENLGWRVAFWLKAAILVMLAVGYLLLLFNRPEEKGLKPYGFGQQQETKKHRRSNRQAWPGVSLQEQLKGPAFYLMCMCFLGSCTCIYMTSLVVVPFFRDLNFSPAAAAGYQSVMMLAVAGAKLLSGAMSDRFGAKPVTVVCMCFAIFGQVLLSVTANPALSYVGVVIFAAGLSMTSSLVSLLATELFGYYGGMHSNGIFLSMSSLAALIATPISNFGYDTMGSYNPVFRIAAVVNVGVLILFFLLFAFAKRDKMRYMAKHV